MIEDDEDDACSWCGGCGEGMYDGAACRKCHGTGVEPIETKDDDYECSSYRDGACAVRKDCRTGGKAMTHAQKVFEAVMKAKGHTDFTQVKGRYTAPNLVTRWNYFLLGWEMREVSK